MLSKFSHGKIKYIDGSAIYPMATDNRIILNIVNTSGELTGFFEELSKKWPKVKEEYRLWFRNQQAFKLGEVQFVVVQSDTIVVNLLAVENDKLNFEALSKCFNKVCKEALLTKSNLHIPQTEELEKTEKLLIDIFVSNGLNINIYR